MREEKQLHQMWLEWSNAPTDFKNRHSFFRTSLIEKWQYLYFVPYKDEVISLIKFRDDMYYPFNWEIYCVAGKELFEDVQRYATKQEAEIMIKQYLEPTDWQTLKRHYKKIKLLCHLGNDF